MANAKNSIKSSSTSTSTDGLENEKSTSEYKRKGDSIDTHSPPQKKRNIIFERELTPDRKPSTSEHNGNIGGLTANPKLVISVKSPEHLLSPEALVKYNTPEKKLERFIDKIKISPKKILFNDSTGECNSKKVDSLLSKVDEMIQNKEHRKKTPKKQTPKKNHYTTNENFHTSLTETTPSKTKKTPKKLFDKSPNNVNEFNVQIIESFVKITPSKSQKSDPNVEFVGSSEKKQSSILKYISPTASAR